MVDTPTTPLTPATGVADSTESINNNTEAVRDNTAAYEQNENAHSKLRIAINGVKDVFDNVTTKIKNAAGSISDLSNMTTEQSMKFGLLQSAAMKAREAYTHIGTQEAAAGMNTFSKQLSNALDIMGDVRGIEGLKKLATQFGVSEKQQNAAGGSMTVLKTIIQGTIGSMLTSADNVARLRTGFVGLAASTGELGKVYDAAGPHLNNINAILQQQSSIMLRTAEATNVPIDMVEQYYSQLGTIPGALSATVTAGGVTTNLLTASIKMAAGTGRDFKSVAEDMRNAVINYGVGGQAALEFTNRMSVLSNKLGIDLQTVRDGLNTVTGSIGAYVDAGAAANRMTSEISSVMQQYTGSLMGTGLSGRHAIEIFKQFTSTIGGLRLEQKALISQTTGGPGGFMGAFQIEQLVRSGNTIELVKKVRESLRAQMAGPIVTQEEAAKSEPAAATMMGQIQTLMSGPFQSLAKDQSSAIRLLEAMRAMDEGKSVDDKSIGDDLKASMDKGSDLQDKTHTILSDIYNVLLSISRSGGFAAAAAVEHTFAAGTGAGAALGPEETARRDHLRATRARAEAEAAQATTQAKTEIDRKAVSDRLGSEVQRSVGKFTDIGAGIGNAASSLVESGKTIAGIKAAAPTADVGKRMIEEANAEKNKREQMKALLPAYGGNILEPPTAPTPGELVAASPRPATPAPPVAAETPPTAARMARVQTHEFNHTINVTGYCLSCKQQIDDNANVRATNTYAADRTTG
jgi:hypothetical protein